MTLGAEDFSPVCRPPMVRLPAQTRIELNLNNNGIHSLAFRAKSFLEQSQVHGVSTAVEEPEHGGYIVPRGGLANLTITTPLPGRYPFACAYPGREPPGRGEFVIAEPPSGGARN